jgi:Fic-DOC domain mobile mystery protein B
MFNFRDTFGNTPLNPDETAGLIPIHISTQAELNEWEQANIVEAELWLSNQPLKINEILHFDFIKKMHHKMFDKTWRWAGNFRRTNKNIGVDWHTISTQLQHLLDDIIFQIANKAYVIDEIAARFHHRLVFIHPFANGNGRWSRLVTDALLISQNRPRFSWGISNSKNTENIRKRYIKALKEADKHNYSLLLKLIRL